MMASSRHFVITGPDEHTRDRFITTLRDRFVICDNVVMCSTNDLESKEEGNRYFLVMPHSSRYNVWVVADKSSMVHEIQLMCGGLPQDNVKEVFIVLYHNTDVTDLFQEDMKHSWEDGIQDQLFYFAQANQFISFNKNLNDKQVKAIAHFTGWKERLQVGKPSQNRTEQTLESTATTPGPNVRSLGAIGTAFLHIIGVYLLSDIAQRRWLWSGPCLSVRAILLFMVYMLGQ